MFKMRFTRNLFDLKYNNFNSLLYLKLFIPMLKIAPRYLKITLNSIFTAFNSNASMLVLDNNFSSCDSITILLVLFFSFSLSFDYVKKLDNNL